MCATNDRTRRPILCVCEWVSECEQCRTHSAPWFDPIVSMCALTSQPDSNEEKESNSIRRHCRHGGRSSQICVVLRCVHRSAHLFLVVPCPYQDCPKCLILSVRPERRDKSQVKWTVLLTMKFESVGIWYSHICQGRQQTTTHDDGTTKEILIEKNSVINA